MTHVEAAHELFFSFLEKTFKNLWKNPTFEHADTSGYWFTFELKNDARRQTWCIRPDNVLEFLKKTGGAKDEKNHVLHSAEDR